MANRFIGGVATSKAKSGTSISRASTGTYFDSSGVLQTAPANQPRLNHSFVGSAWTQPAVLIEPASINEVYKSESFDDAQWGKSNSSILANSTTAPDGTTTADTLVEDASNSYHTVSQNPSKPNGSGPFTLSVFAKANTRTAISLSFNNSTTEDNGYASATFDLSNGTTGTVTGRPSVKPSATITPAGNGWYRCSLSAAGVGPNFFHIGVSNSITPTLEDYGRAAYVGDSTSSIYIWGAQLEQTWGPTSYIPSPNNSTATRAADIVAPTVQPLMSLGDHYNLSSTDSAYKIDTYTLIDTDYTWTAPEGVDEVEVLVVAGGGGGGGAGNTGGGAGGGAGGLIYNASYSVTPGTTYPIVVGDGGIGGISSANATNGENSQFGSLIALGGGLGVYAERYYPSATNGAAGGSGGGGGRSQSTPYPLEGPSVAGQGHPGGGGSIGGGSGGGGGGGAPGQPAGRVNNTIADPGGSGGTGLYFNISGTSTAYAGGGGGGAFTGAAAGLGGLGGGGAGATGANNGSLGIDGTGGGGGGAGGRSGSTGNGGAGGSGIVIVKYRRKSTQAVATTTDAIVTQKFTTTNIWTVPEGVTEVEALVVAGGGSGGDTGAGGAGGLIYNPSLSVTPSTTYSIGVGGGGAYGPYSGFGSGIGTGPELITNGNTFTTTTGWTATTATLSIPQPGTFRITPNISVNGTASQSITTVIGTTYLLVIKVTSDTSRILRIRVGTTQVGSEVNDGLWTERTRDSLDNGATGAGFYSQTFTATSTTTWINLQVGNGTGQPTDISHISVRQTSTAAFGGGVGGNSGTQATSGGSGGGGTYAGATSGGAGVAGQGNAGGKGGNYSAGHAGGGGGGAGGTGNDAGLNDPGPAGNGGPGLPFNFVGSPEYYAGGGGAGVNNNANDIAGKGGIGGGGAGGQTTAGRAGATNTGGGGGGGAYGASFLGGGRGGSGVAILRYRVPAVAEFKDSGTWTCPAGVYSVQALVVAGGGGGGFCLTGDGGGGGGGAGGLVYSTSVPVTPGTTYPIVVGQGGAPAASQTVNGANGANSNFANLISIGGGGGGSTRATGSAVINSGGSGGGAGSDAGGDTGGSGTYGQGNAGGNNSTGNTGAGGGGAGSIGVSVSAAADVPNGGAGLAYSISGTSTTYAGGGGGGKFSGGTGAAGAGGAGGGGGGGKGFTGLPGSSNTGGGGGGGGMISSTADKAGGSGGSGIVIIRWFEN